jgi:hypothetical protein
VTPGRLARLSLAALQHGQELAFDDAERLALWLYAYNRMPATREFEHACTPVRLAALFLAPGESWEQLAAGPPYGPWWVWRSRRSQAGAAPSCKLYVSPRPTQFTTAVRTALDVLAGTGAMTVKFGGDANGVLRPDKLVAYFSEFAALRCAAQCLESALAGCPVHGVPFTAELGADGLLSWGMDPPAAIGVGVSWRSWLTLQLARAMIEAKRSGAAEPWRCALERVRARGVDPDTWVPRSDLWTHAGDPVS